MAEREDVLGNLTRQVEKLVVTKPTDRTFDFGESSPITAYNRGVLDAVHLLKKSDPFSSAIGTNIQRRLGMRA